MAVAADSHLYHTSIQLAIIQQNNIFYFFVIFILDNGIYYQLYINNIENSNRFSVGWHPLWTDRKRNKQDI